MIPTCTKVFSPAGEAFYVVTAGNKLEVQNPRTRETRIIHLTEDEAKRMQFHDSMGKVREFVRALEPVERAYWNG